MINASFNRLFTAFIVFITAAVAVSGQIPGTGAAGNTRTPQVEQSEAQIRQVTDTSGRFFKEGLLALKDNRRSAAGEKFDESLEVFLLSTLNVQRNETLRSCYNQLIETIYRIEFRSNQAPNIRSLAATCRWDIQNELADEIAELVVKTPERRSETAAPDGGDKLVRSAGDLPSEDELAVGFDEQKFVPSPLDELAKLQLTVEEENIDTPVAQQQLRYARVAVANRSLGFSFQVHPKIQQFLNYYQGRGRRTMEVGLYRSGMFMLMARRIFREEGVPENIAWLGQVESAWKPQALSWASASGLWQFIPSTGSRFGLRRTAYVDERNGFEKATRASARYLKYLANRYNGNWELAMGAYNCGEGNVDRAIRRAGQANFWAAYPYLPRETRNYVPNILATILIANNPQRYGFGHIRPAPPLRYDQIRVPASTSLNLLAQASDTSVQYLRYLNPELRTNTTPPEPFIVRVPAGKANDVVALFRRRPTTRNSDVAAANTVRGETWESLATRLGFSAQELRALNGNAPVPGRKVFVPARGNGVTATAYSRPTSQNSPVRSGRIKIVKARAGETVADVAKRFNAEPAEVARFNGLYPQSKLHGGREIKIPKTKIPTN